MQSFAFFFFFLQIFMYGGRGGHQLFAFPRLSHGQRPALILPSLCKSGVGIPHACDESIQSVARPLARTVGFTSSDVLLAHSFRVILPHRTPMRQHGRSGTDVCTDVVRTYRVAIVGAVCPRNTQVSLHTHVTEMFPEYTKPIWKTNRE
jgi:hypothetical protein